MDTPQVELIKDFRNFLFVVWEHLNLPEPTPVQYDIAQYLQDHDEKRIVIEAFRGVGKSYITSAYACHQLLLNPEVKILVVSASKIRADDFSTFTMRLITEMPLLQHLIPKGSQRQSKISFDVGPAKASHSPSVKSAGITGQLAGSRADIVIADDIEIPNNSMTQTMRDKISEAVKEFDAILKPEGRVIYLGTPQTEMSLYETLPERGYKPLIWPSRVPKNIEKYGGKLAPIVLKHIEEGAEEGAPLDPLRFDDLDLTERELSYGRSGFALQFMLDTAMSDADRYPLKLEDLIVMDIDNDKAPEKVVWGRSKDKIIDIPNVGMPGDYFYPPIQIVGNYISYTGSVLAIDPSGRGKDETAFAVVKMLNGTLYVIDFGGISGGYSSDTLQALSVLARKYKVNQVLIESNFGDGMFSELLKPVLTKIYPCSIEEVRHNIQKEKRIVDTLEPVMNQHRLVIDQKALERDYHSVQHYPPEMQSRYMLAHQMTRVTKERGALTHDDRLDVLSMAVSYWVDQMAADVDVKMSDRKEEMLDMELEKFLENAINPLSIPNETNSYPMWN
jgi:hypothetical protein|tara:strand:- start:16944 stop:18623 length:1680 start_codon:yes stop_codon:yes gene_type:complete